MSSSDVYSVVQKEDTASYSHETAQNLDLTPQILVVGVGGAGGNAVNNMVSSQIDGIKFIAANTDSQALGKSTAPKTIQLGPNITQGLGAGSDPSVGEAAAEEAADELKAALKGTNLLFLAAGMGGGTGTGATSVIARMAKELGILTIGVVTKPFAFEGARRMRIAEEGIRDLRGEVDTLIVIPNQNLFRLANEKTSFADAFVMADKVLNSGITCVTDLILKEGLINLDFADIKAVIEGMGNAMMGVGVAKGEGRAIKAASEAISNPLIDDVTLKGAKGLLINISGGLDMTLYEVDEAANHVRAEVDEDANVIIGATFDSDLESEMKVAIVASGLQSVEGKEAPPTPKAVQETIVASFVDPDQNEDEQDLIEPEVKTYQEPATAPIKTPELEPIPAVETAEVPDAQEPTPDNRGQNQGVSVQQGMPQFMADKAKASGTSVQPPQKDSSMMGERVRVGQPMSTRRAEPLNERPLDQLTQEDFPPHAQKQQDGNDLRVDEETIESEGFFEKLSKLRHLKESQPRAQTHKTTPSSQPKGLLMDHEINHKNPQADDTSSKVEQSASSTMLPEFLKRKN